MNGLTFEQFLQIVNLLGKEPKEKIQPIISVLGLLMMVPAEKLELLVNNSLLKSFLAGSWASAGSELMIKYLGDAINLGNILAETKTLNHPEMFPFFKMRRDMEVFPDTIKIRMTSLRGGDCDYMQDCPCGAWSLLISGQFQAVVNSFPGKRLVFLLNGKVGSNNEGEIREGYEYVKIAPQTEFRVYGSAKEAGSCNVLPIVEGVDMGWEFTQEPD